MDTCWECVLCSSHHECPQSHGLCTTLNCLEKTDYFMKIHLKKLRKTMKKCYCYKLKNWNLPQKCIKWTTKFKTLTVSIKYMSHTGILLSLHRQRQYGNVTNRKHRAPCGVFPLNQSNRPSLLGQCTIYTTDMWHRAQRKQSRVYSIHQHNT